MNLERRKPAPPPVVGAVVGMRVLHRATRVSGTVSKVMVDGISVTTPSGERLFRYMDAGFVANGAIVTLTRPAAATVKPTAPKRSASGSIEDPAYGIARVARASRIWVEGLHDAELLERVWGDDLRAGGIVVERTDGIDTLSERANQFSPGPTRRLGVLVDHLVEGSKEQRIAYKLEDAHEPYVIVRGTPFVDVWQAIRPKAIGIKAWPVVPRGEDWKTGICTRLRAPDPPKFWRQLLARVNSYVDLEPELVGAVEELLDHLGTSDND
jgi:hypothetical protein